MKLHTESESVYELDEARKRIRRLSGNGDPTRRTGQDGAWREYESVKCTASLGTAIYGPLFDEIKPGYLLLITWPDGTKPAAVSGAVPGTLTSRILRIEQ